VRRIIPAGLSMQHRNELRRALAASCDADSCADCLIQREINAPYVDCTTAELARLVRHRLNTGMCSVRRMARLLATLERQSTEAPQAVFELSKVGANKASRAKPGSARGPLAVTVRPKRVRSGAGAGRRAPGDPEDSR
jgi:hypothetical protein